MFDELELIKENVVEAAGVLGTSAPLRRLAYRELLDGSISILGYRAGLRMVLLLPM